MGIVSNATYAPFIAWALEQHDLRHHFEQIVVSAEIGIRKPRREIFAAALNAMRLTPADAVYVGNDYIKDVMGAKLAGLQAIWVPEPEARDFRAYTPVQPDAIADRFDRLPGIVAGWGA
jgi:putative hydrolase of the HAD superfamily